MRCYWLHLRGVFSDAFEEKYAELVNDEYADPEDQDEYVAENERI